MASESQQPSGRDNTLSTLNRAIDALNLAKDISAIAPAQAAFSAVVALLTVVRVLRLLFCTDGLLIHISPGLRGQRTGLHQTGVVLRRYLYGASPRSGRKEPKRPQSVSARGNKPVDDVS